MELSETEGFMGIYLRASLATWLHPVLPDPSAYIADIQLQYGQR